jgi:hypothetical protein
MLARDQGNNTGKENLKQNYLSSCSDIVVNFSNVKGLKLGLTLTGSEKNKVLTNSLDFLNKKSQSLLARDLGSEASCKTVSDFLAKTRLSLDQSFLW